MCSSSYEGSIFAMVFGLAFFGAFSAYKLVTPARHSPGGLASDDVLLGMDLLRLQERWSKTYQFGRGTWIFFAFGSWPGLSF